MVWVNMATKTLGRTIMLRCSDTRLVAMVNQTTTGQVGELEVAAALSVMLCVIPGGRVMSSSEVLLWSLLNTCVDM